MQVSASLRSGCKVSEHTPGPWATQRYVVDRHGNEVGSTAPGDLSERRRIVAVEDDDCAADCAAGPIIADMVAGGPNDARLIAAAPDLLEALVALFGLVESGALVRDTSKDFAPDYALRMLDLVATLKAAQSAIAKAEGHK